MEWLGSGVDWVGSGVERVGSGVEGCGDWKSESVTYLRTNRLTWVGARDTCVSKNYTGGVSLEIAIKIVAQQC